MRRHGVGGGVDRPFGSSVYLIDSDHFSQRKVEAADAAQGRETEVAALREALEQLRQETVCPWGFDDF